MGVGRRSRSLSIRLAAPASDVPAASTPMQTSPRSPDHEHLPHSITTSVPVLADADGWRSATASMAAFRGHRRCEKHSATSTDCRSDRSRHFGNPGHPVERTMALGYVLPSWLRIPVRGVLPQRHNIPPDAHPAMTPSTTMHTGPLGSTIHVLRADAGTIAELATIHWSRCFPRVCLDPVRGVMAGHEACHFSAHRPREPRATSRRPHRPPSHRRSRSRRDWGWRRTPGRPRAGPRADRGGLPGRRARPPATRGPR